MVSQSRKGGHNHQMWYNQGIRDFYSILPSPNFLLLPPPLPPLGSSSIYTSKATLPVKSGGPPNSISSKPGTSATSLKKESMALWDAGMMHSM